MPADKPVTLQDYVDTYSGKPAASKDLNEKEAGLIEKSFVNQLADYMHALGEHASNIKGIHLGLGFRLEETSREIRHLKWITDGADYATLTMSLFSLIKALYTPEPSEAWLVASNIQRFCKNVLPHLPATDKRVVPTARKLLKGTENARKWNPYHA